MKMTFKPMNKTVFYIREVLTKIVNPMLWIRLRTVDYEYDKMINQIMDLPIKYIRPCVIAFKSGDSEIELWDANYPYSHGFVYMIDGDYHYSDTDTTCSYWTSRKLRKLSNNYIELIKKNVFSKLVEKVNEA